MSVTTVTLPLDLSTECIEVKLNAKCQINGNKTEKAIASVLKQSGLWSGPPSGLKGIVRARTSKDGSGTLIESIDITAEAFRDQGGSFLVSAAALTGNLTKNVKALNSQVSELRADLDEVKARHRADLDEVKARLKIVEAESAEFRKVAFRYVISEVHKKIEASLGEKAQGQLWSDYLQNQYLRNPDWFKRRQLGFAELALLSKGPHTQYEAGNEAAHRPDTALVNRIVGEAEGESWRRLWNVASS